MRELGMALLIVVAVAAGNAIGGERSCTAITPDPVGFDEMDLKAMMLNARVIRRIMGVASR